MQVFCLLGVCPVVVRRKLRAVYKVCNKTNRYKKNYGRITSYLTFSYFIIHKFKLVSQSHDIHLQLISIHMDFHGNNVADKLAMQICKDTYKFGTFVTFLESFTNIKSLDNLSCLASPTHHWYNMSSLVLFLLLN